MKKILSLTAALLLIFSLPLTAFAKIELKSGAENTGTIGSSGVDFDLGVNSAYLIEANTGTVIYAHNESEAASPASVTKIMTLLLVCEALAAGKFALTDTVTVSEHAASMGGSQVFLEEGERMTVEDLLKCTVIASANDAAVALAELTHGSEATFVAAMNRRAAELGLKNTAFENTTGLDDTTTNHYSSAEDIAIMSRELIKHDIILKYSSLWQDTIRNGEFTLTNTNRLVRYYDGCNGLKTGSTDKAGFCVSTTAKRGNMQLIAVIMGAPTRDARNNAARILLDYGFASFGLFEKAEGFIENIPVLGGKLDYVPAYNTAFCALVDKSKLSSVEELYDIPESVSAPVTDGQVIGSVTYMLDGEELGRSDILARGEVGKITVIELFLRILTRAVCG